MTQVTLELEVLDACPICGGEAQYNVKRRQIPGANYAVSYSQCGDCWSLFLNPRMTDACTDDYYRETYRKAMMSNQAKIDLDLKIQQGRSTVQAAIIRKYCKPKSHLEIGCSAGFLLDAMKKAGVKKSVGVDPDKMFTAMEPANKFNVVSSLDEVEPQPFDLISMSHSLEHLNHPGKFLGRLVKDYARPGTTIMVEVPNAATNENAFLIHHPYAYTEAIMTKLFDRYGCKVVMTGNLASTSGISRYLIALYEVM